MTQQHTYTLSELAQIAGCDVVGDASIVITQLATLADAKAGELAYFSDAKMRPLLLATTASAVIVTPKEQAHCPCAALVCDNPQLAFAAIAAKFQYQPARVAGQHASSIVADSARVDASAVIGPNVVLGERCEIGPDVVIDAGCVIGDDAVIGAGSHLYPRVTLYHGVSLGERVIVHAGAVIGSDGFGNVLNEQHQWVAVPQLGSVRIGNDVSIGANTTIDCGALNDTVIEDGVRLDNQIQVAHNVRIGAHTAVAGCAGIAGSADIGAHCMIGGGVCIGGHLSICDGVMLTGMSMVTRSITQPGVYSSGTGLQTNKEWHKSVVRFRQLDDMAKRIKRIEKNEA